MDNTCCWIIGLILIAQTQAKFINNATRKRLSYSLLFDVEITMYMSVLIVS